jgi:hypothetical protein
MFDEEFYQEQAFLFRPRHWPANDAFELFLLYEGVNDEPIRVGTIPSSMQRALQTSARIVYLCPRTLFGHIRNHKQHPVGFDLVRWIPWIVEHGNAVGERGRDVVFFAKLPGICERPLFVAAHIDGPESGLWIKSFGARRQRDANAKLKHAFVLRRCNPEMERAA